MTTPAVQAFSPVILYGPNGQKVTASSLQQEASLQTQGYSTSPSGVLTTTTSGTSSTNSTTEQKKGHHSFSVTMTKIDSKTGKTTSVTASSKAQVDAYEAQGYVLPDKTSGGAKPMAQSPSGTLTTASPAGNALKD